MWCKCDITQPCGFLSRLFHDVERSQSLEHSEFGCKPKQICKFLEWDLGKLTANLSGHMLKMYATCRHTGGDWCVASHILNLVTNMGVSSWLHDQATLPKGKIAVTIAGVDILCRCVVLIGCWRSGDPDHELVLQRSCLWHPTPCGA